MKPERFSSSVSASGFCGLMGALMACRAGRRWLGEFRKWPCMLWLANFVLAAACLGLATVWVRMQAAAWLPQETDGRIHPIWVMVGNQPARASRRSAPWCLQGVDPCWSQKERFFKADELEGGKRDYALEREACRRLLGECDVD